MASVSRLENAPQELHFNSVEEPEPATHKEAMASSHTAEWRIAEQGGKTEAAAAASVKI